MRRRVPELAAGLALGALTAPALMWARMMLCARRARPVPADAILIFGAALWADGPSPELRARVDKAADLYVRGYAPRVVCSGGEVGGRSETAEMREVLVARGVPRDAIVTDDRGLTTRLAVASMLDLDGGRWASVVVVTTPYHLHRAVREARRHGLDAVGCAAPLPRTGSRIPTTRAELGVLELRVRQHLREIVAVWWYALSWRFEKPLCDQDRRADVDSSEEIDDVVFGHRDAAVGGADPQP